MNRKMIGLPWRAFKAFHQKFCIDTMGKDMLRNHKYVSLFDSDSSESQRHVSTMIEKGLLYRIEVPESNFPEFDSPSAEVKYIDDLLRNSPEQVEPYLERNKYRGSKSLVLSKRVAPYGYETAETKVVVYPKKSSGKGAAWMASKGHCVFCGSALTLFKRDVLTRMPVPYSGQYLACKSCHSTKTGHTLEEMRILMAMREFEEITGLRFSLDQLSFLEKVLDIKPKDIMIEHYEFYFEKMGIPLTRVAEEQSHEMG
jgi:hypothetical protein